MNAKKLATEKAEALAEVEAARVEATQIEHESTAQKLERNRLRQRAANQRLMDISREEKRLAAAVLNADSRHEELRQRIIEAMHRRNGIAQECVRGIGTKYIRADAVGFFGRDVEAAKKRIAEIERFRAGLKPNQSLGPRYLTELRDLEAVVGEWPKTEKLCIAGQKMWNIDQEIKQLREAQDALQAEARDKALAVA